MSGELNNPPWTVQGLFTRALRGCRIGGRGGGPGAFEMTSGNTILYKSTSSGGATERPPALIRPQQGWRRQKDQLITSTMLQPKRRPDLPSTDTSTGSSLLERFG